MGLPMSMEQFVLFFYTLTWDSPCQWTGVVPLCIPYILTYLWEIGPLCILTILTILTIWDSFLLPLKISATALCATAWLRGHEFCVPSSVLEFWLMVDGFDLEKLPFGGVHIHLLVVPVPKIHPPPDLQKSIFSLPGPLKINIYAP